MVAQGAIVSEGITSVPERRHVTDARITVAAPWNIDLPQGSFFALLRTHWGEAPCLQRKPFLTFTPPEDESGEIFPGMCLLDLDGDKRFEKIRFRPYNVDASPRDADIAPVGLKPARPGEDPHKASVLAHRRIRIDRAGSADATFVLEDGIGFTGRTDRSPFLLAGNITLPLREGAEAELGGVSLRVGRSPGGWTVVSSGSFAPWVTVTEEGTALNIGEGYLRPRHH